MTVRRYTSVALFKKNQMNYDSRCQPPYSPDLAPSDFQLFPKVKLFLAGRKVKTDEEVIVEVQHYFDDLDGNDDNGTQALLVHLY